MSPATFDTMKILLLGDGTRERDWARWIQNQPEHELVEVGKRAEGLEPVTESSESLPAAEVDLDAALAIPDIELAIVGGPAEFRMEALRRVAGMGLSCVCLHPPGPDSEAYYQVSLTREETGSIIVPDLPLRLEPAITALKSMISDGSFGRPRSVRIELSRNAKLSSSSAVEEASRAVDLARSLMGDFKSVWAISQPSRGTSPGDLHVYLATPLGSNAEIIIRPADSLNDRISVQVEGEFQSANVELSDPQASESRLTLSTEKPKASQSTTHPNWDPHQAILDVVRRSTANRELPTSRLPGPNLDDGIRAMEITEAIVRSLFKERKIDLYHQKISEEANFKSVMTSVGCMILLSILFVLPVSLAGPAIGLPWLLYLSYAIPLALGVFAISQIFRLAVRGSDDDRTHTSITSTD